MSSFLHASKSKSETSYQAFWFEMAQTHRLRALIPKVENNRIQQKLL